jgi:hypothetical protein
VEISNRFAASENLDESLWILIVAGKVLEKISRPQPKKI